MHRCQYPFRIVSRNLQKARRARQVPVGSLAAFSLVVWSSPVLWLWLEEVARIGTTMSNAIEERMAVSGNADPRIWS